MSVSLSDLQKNALKDIAKKEGIEEFEVETKPGGDGSFGSIIAVCIKNPNKKLDIIVKSASKNEKVRKMNPVRGAYLREIYVYENILPAYHSFEKEMEVDCGFSAYPKIYGSIQIENNECLFLENLNEIGFKLWDSKVPMDSEHVALVLNEYAKFHAVSLAMSFKKPDKYHDLTQDLTNVFESHSLVMAKTALQFGRKAVVGNEIANEALDRLSNCLEYFLSEEIERVESKVVVVHNDGWCNNVMFKYEDQQNLEKPSKASIIDWQLAQTGTPVMDLSYFIFTCGSMEVLTEYAKYLKTYHDALSKHLGKMACDAKVLFPFSALLNHWEKYSKFGLFVSLIMIKFMLSEKNEVPNISQMARSGMTFVDRLNFESIHDEAYNKRISDIITIMAKYGLI